MPDTPGSLMGHAARVACLTLACGSRLFAQSADPAPSPVRDVFPRYEFRLAANALAIDDPRFSWDAHLGGDLDVFDYGKGRLSASADYEVVLGDEFRAFDPNQAYYTLATSASYRVGSTEVAGLLHHVSRHLSDRFKSYPIAWNVVGARALRQMTTKGMTIDGRAGIGAVVERASVDYTWTGDLDVTVRRGLSPRVGVFAHGAGVVFGVDGTIHNRGTQAGGLIEGGVRFEGRAAAFELVAGFERRVDADPQELLPLSWGFAGFRLLSK